MKPILLFIFVITFISSSAQIHTKYFPNNQSNETKKYTTLELKKITYNTNYQSIKEKKYDEKGAIKYGDVVPAKINNKSHGHWINDETWMLLIVSPEAKSIEVIIDNIVLPLGAEINVFDVNRKMIFGPIKNSNINKGLPIATDIMLGDSIFVQLSLDKDITNKNDVSFSIIKIIHGFKESVKPELKSAAYCEVDVECSTGEGWEFECDGVGKIYGNGWMGSCALLNNTALDYTPYILTAKHIIDSIGSASYASIRFNYKATECDGSIAATGITISSLSTKASNSASDLTLLESSVDLSDVTSITFLGWNRVPSPNSVVCLHHPDGDFMSISKESTTISTSSQIWVSVNDWDIGSIEPGSSGSPLFDHNKRVIATTSFINSPDYICTPDLESYHGKLSYFWSSISSYLDPCNTGAAFINSIKTTTALSSIVGNSVICEEGTTYQLNHVLGDATVTWEVSPTNLFDTPTSGTGSNPTLYANNNSTNGLGQLKFFIGCTTVTKNVWVGDPITPEITGNPFVDCTYSLFTDANMQSVTWSVYGPLQIVGPNQGYKCTVQGTGTGMGWVYATASNDCNPSVRDEFMVQVSCGLLLIFTPNPTSGETIVSIETDSQETTFDETAPWDLEVYSETQLLKTKQTNLRGQSAKIQTAGWQEGIYIVRVNYNDEILTGKLMVKR